MKISHSNTPVLNFLKDGTFRPNYKIPESEKDTWGHLGELAISSLPKYRENLTIFSKEMQQVLYTVGNKMTSDDLWNALETQSGTLILDGYSFCYNIVNHNNDMRDFYISMFMFTGDCHLAGFLYQNPDEETEKQIMICPAAHQLQEEQLEGLTRKEFTKKHVGSVYAQLVSALNFLKYAEVQDKVIMAKSKTGKIRNDKVINDSEYDAHFITSHYINNLFVEGVFKVTGHWRLQPKKKDGKWTKELIWISEFEKKGYTRKAGILTNDYEHNNL